MYKRQAYACDITYGTNNEYGFDYLIDNMVIYKDQLVPVSYTHLDVYKRQELDGVKYYNDSIGTSPASTIAGLNAFDENIILLAGGSDKGFCLLYTSRCV